MEQVLAEDARSRNDDKWLVYSVYRKITKIFIPFEDFEKLPSPETITRMRRDFQYNKGKYQATENINKNRRSREKQYEIEYSGV